MTKQQFKAFFIEKWLLTRIFFQLKLDGLRLSLAVFMCNALQKARNKRFYVIENAQGKLIWVCNDDINQMKRPRRVRRIINGRLSTFTVRMLPKSVSHLDIMKSCLYYTPSSWNNSDGLTQAERLAKRQGWLKYMEQIRMNRMFGNLSAKH